MNGLFLIAIAVFGFGALALFAWDFKSNKAASPREPSLDRDKRLIAQGMCPDCEKSELLGGPSGGMSQNVGCNNCLMEFNVHHSFGGLLGVDRTGKMSESRAGTFGISPEEYREIVARVDELDPRDKLDPYFNPDGN